MRIVPSMLMIGAAERAVGKTAFACALIRRESLAGQVLAVKITTVRDREGQCPRGGHGCGSCGALDADFCITEELECDAGTDTSRMLAAGAHRVFWLRAHESHLAAGLARLLSGIPAGMRIICESNSARQVIEPGAFLVVRSRGSVVVKPSCANVLQEADREIIFDGSGWDCSPDCCCFENGRWTVPALATGAVLAGGRSRRMGRDKSLLPFRDTTLVGHVVAQLRPFVDELLVGTNDPDAHRALGAKLVPDEQLDQGPLMGILSCVRQSAYERVFVSACDIPELPPEIVRQMLRRARDFDVVMTSAPDGEYQPLPVALRRRITPTLCGILQRGGRRITELCQAPQLRLLRLETAPSSWYRNINTAAEYQDLLRPKGAIESAGSAILDAKSTVSPEETNPERSR